MTYLVSLEGAPGAFVIDENTSEFTYTLTAAELAVFDAANDNNGNSFFQVGIEATNGLPFNDPNGLNDSDDFEFNIMLCFSEGTNIATPSGEVPVEALRIGDPILTATGTEVPVRWVGRLSINPIFTPAERLEPRLAEAFRKAS